MSVQITGVDATASAEIASIAPRLRERITRSVADLRDIGRDLLRAKELIPHGQFSEWLEREFSLSHRQANRFMDVARRFDGMDAASSLPSGVLLELSASNVPDALVEAVVAGRVPATVTAVREQLRGHSRRVAGRKAARDLMSEFWRLPDSSSAAADALTDAIFDAAEADESETFFDWIAATLELTLEQLREAVE